MSSTTRSFRNSSRTAEARILETRLFEPDTEVEFDWLERFDDPAQLLVDIKEDWDGCHVPAELEARIRAAEPPVDIWERVVLRRFRASRNRG